MATLANIRLLTLLSRKWWEGTRLDWVIRWIYWKLNYAILTRRKRKKLN